MTAPDLLSQAVANASPAVRAGGSGGVEHVVVLMLENRSFDHFLSWLPGADGRHNMTYLATDGNVYPNYPLARTSRAAVTATRTTAGRAFSSSTISGRWTASCSGQPRRPICPG
jgi:phospholipase C